MQTIFVHENDQYVREVLIIAIEQAGYQVLSTADCGPEQIEIIDAAQPDLILLDFKVSGKPAIRLCELLKNYRPEVPVLALSCNSNIKDQYAKYGFDGCIEKPFDLKVLLAVINLYTGTRLSTKKSGTLKAAISMPRSGRAGKQAPKSNHKPRSLS